MRLFSVIFFIHLFYYLLLGNSTYSQLAKEPEFPKFREILIKKITLSGNTAFSNEKILSFFNLKTKNNEYTFQSSIHALLEEYENSGFPFAVINIENIEYLRDHLDTAFLSFSIQEKKKIFIKEVKIFGNESTRDNVIFRELDIRQGAAYNKRKINEIPSKLSKLELFKNIEAPFLTVNDSGGILNIRLQEEKPNMFDGILGYQPSTSDNSGGYFSGMLNFNFGNLFGTGRKLKIYWKKENQNSEQLNIKYLEPWLFNYPLNIIVMLDQKKYDSLLIKRNLSLINSCRIFDNSFLNFSLNYENNLPAQEVLNFGKIKNKAFLYGVELVYDSRNSPSLPSSGFFYSNKFEYGSKNYSQGTNKIIKKYYLRTELFNPLFSNQTLYNSINGIMVQKDELEITDLIFLGGISNLRGYRENQFLVNNALWLNSEYRFFFDEYSSIFPFFDIGYYIRMATADGFPKDEDLLYSYGFGMTLSTQIGLLKVIYAIGKGNSLTKGNIHFGVVAPF